jgi:hypothetical protein
VETVEGVDLVLEAGGEVVEGDTWEGLYRFDSVLVTGSARLHSDDPIEAQVLDLDSGGQLTGASPEGVVDLIMGTSDRYATLWTPVTASGAIEIVGLANVVQLTAPVIAVRAGSVLSHPSGQALSLTADSIVVEDDASIDVSARGYAAEQTHPGETLGTHYTVAGSHLGEGGLRDGSPGSTYGSVTRPMEAGAGGGSGSSPRGGGLIRIEAAALDLQGTASIRADGGSNDGYAAGAGGSIWVTADEVLGTGVIEARGGPSTNYGTGGGGAIAVEYGSALSATVEAGLSAATTAGSSRLGGAGTIFIRGPTSAHGDLLVDNAGLSGGRTILPALGSGIAQPGSGGARIVTDRASLPAYVKGRWVRITDSGGVERGRWRVETVEGVDLVLEAGGEVVEGDTWEGLYRFDSVIVDGNARLVIPDPDEIGTVVVEPGSTLELQPAPLIFGSELVLPGSSW